MNQLLLKIDNLMEGQVIKRPSQYIKTPYVADIKCVDTLDQVLGHTASLGCCGLVDVNASILMAVSPEPKTKTVPKNKANMKCTHTVYLSVLRNNGNERNANEQIIGIHPKLAEKLTENALTNNLLSRLQNIKNTAEKQLYI